MTWPLPFDCGPSERNGEAAAERPAGAGSAGRCPGGNRAVRVRGVGSAPGPRSGRGRRGYGLRARGYALGLLAISQPRGFRCGRRGGPGRLRVRHPRSGCVRPASCPAAEFLFGRRPGDLPPPAWPAHGVGHVRNRGVGLGRRNPGFPQRVDRGGTRPAVRAGSGAGGISRRAAAVTGWRSGGGDRAAPRRGRNPPGGGPDPGTKPGRQGTARRRGARCQRDGRAGRIGPDHRAR